MKTWRLMLALIGGAIIALPTMSQLAEADTLVLKQFPGSPVGPGGNAPAEFGDPVSARILKLNFVEDTGWVPEAGSNTAFGNPLDYITVETTAVKDGDPNEPIGGTWSYAPGAGDPLVKYWGVKSATQWQAFFFVAAADAACASLAACLPLAVALGGGTYDWISGVSAAASNIVFWDSINPIPIPPALLLFVSGLAGLGLLGRRRRAQQSV